MIKIQTKVIAVVVLMLLIIGLKPSFMQNVSAGGAIIPTSAYTSACAATAYTTAGAYSKGQPSNAIDGVVSYTSRWRYLTSSPIGTKYVTFDLGSVKTFSQVSFYTYLPEGQSVTCSLQVGNALNSALTSSKPFNLALETNSAFDVLSSGVTLQKFTSQIFPNIDVRYVRFAFTFPGCVSGDTQNVVEIYLTRGNEKLDFSQTKYIDNTSAEIASYQNAGEITATTTVSNLTEDLQSFTMVSALYLDNKLLNVSVKTFELEPNSINNSCAITISIEDPVDTVIKTFFLDGSNCLIPLKEYDSIKYSKEEVIEGFIHPGVLNSERDLAYMKMQVNSTDDNVMKQGYDIMLSSALSQSDYVHKPFKDVEVIPSGTCESEDRYRQDAYAAYANALKWIVTGDLFYRDKSIQILNDWASTYETVWCTSSGQITLEASWALPIWVSAGELIRYYDHGSANWSAQDIKQFESFIRKMTVTVSGPCASAANWKASRALANMSAGVFLNDRKLYNTGYAQMVTQIALIGAKGTPSENTRDFIHCQYNVIATSHGAEIAFNQGEPALYLQKRTGEGSSVKPLLYRQSEYFVLEQVGPVPTGGVDYTKNKSRTPPYEMLVSRYKYDFNIEIPLTESFVIEYNRPEKYDGHFVPWGSLTHGDISYAR